MPPRCPNASWNALHLRVLIQQRFFCSTLRCAAVVSTPPVSAHAIATRLGLPDEAASAAEVAEEEEERGSSGGGSRI